MYKTVTFLACITLNLALAANADQGIENTESNTPLLDISAAPSSIVGGAVNVITGSYVETNCDFVIPGANPFTVLRSYNSANLEPGNLWHGWDLNFPSILETKNSDTEILATVNDRGAKLLFRSKDKKKMKICRDTLKYGVTNCSSGVINSRSNMINKKLASTGSYHYELSEESGEKLTYERKNRTHDSTYSVVENLLPTGCKFKYDYDDKRQLARVDSKGTKGNSLSHIRWEHPNDFKSALQLTLHSSCNQKVTYKFQGWTKGKKYRYGLSAVIREHAPEIHYSYSKPGEKIMERINRKSLPDYRFLQIEYYELGKNSYNNTITDIDSSKDSRLGRVLALYAPVGIDEKPIKIWNFKYILNRAHLTNKPFGGKTEVTDGLGHKKLYHFSDEQRLTKIEHFLDNGHLYRTERMYWGEHKDEKTFLFKRRILDDNSTIIIGKDYSYDDYGNVLKETLYGNLRGLENNSEKFITTYTYTENGLLKTETKGRKHIVYHYLKGTNLINLKLVYGDNVIRERYSYTYDNNRVLIKEIVDDGDSADINNLSNVIERHIKVIKPTTTSPIGLPEVIEEKYLNFLTGQDELLTRTENSYTIEGHPQTQKVFDDKDTYQYSKEWFYDSHGNLKREVNALGQITTCEYDQNNNRIYQQSPNLNYCTKFTYDYSNRLIRKENIYNDGLILSQEFTYDFMGNRTSFTDEYKNTTKFTYDEFGRLISKIHPPIYTYEGKVEEYVEKMEYDHLNHPTQKIDTNGFVTNSLWTVRGNVYSVEAPDGSIEKNIYDYDGSLLKTTNSKGVETHYTYDYQGRKLSEETLKHDREQLSLRRWVYNTFHLIEEIDPEGYQTTYTYDSAGRQIAINKGKKSTKFVYDSLGRKSETWESYEPEKWRKNVVSYDFLDRVVHECIKDETETVLSQKSYRYDCDGNRTHVIVHTDTGDVCTETQYNNEKKPIKIIQPDGSETLYEYDYTFRNDIGQIVPFTKEIDANGIQTITIMDACGRMSKLIRKNSSNTPIQASYYQYNGEGNLIKRSDDVIVNGIVERKIHLGYRYDSRNREIALIEAVGSPLEKITYKEYNLHNELAVLTKPDGVKLYHEYDCLGRLAKQYSSDHSISYVNSYDRNSNVIKVEDLILGLTTLRTINQNNCMIFEELGTGLKSSYDYDNLGRVKKVVWPELCVVEYSYDAANLRMANRIKNSSSFLCCYDFNSAGKISRIEMAKSAVTVNYKYDTSLRIDAIESQNFSEAIPAEGRDACGNVQKITLSDYLGKLDCEYGYDDLYHLISEKGVFDHTYAYDSIHNRLFKNGCEHSVNDLNQVTALGDKKYEFDPNGNQSKKSHHGQDYIFNYDALDRLKEVIQGNRKTSYIYDSFHRRLRKTFHELNGGEWIESNKITFIYQGDKEIGALDKEGKVTELRTLGLGINGEIGAAMLLEIKDRSFFPLHDFRGNVVALINVEDGSVEEAYRYSAFGEEQIFNQNRSSCENAISPWRFSSKRFDPETGWNFYGRRYYDCELGKWTTPDPLGFKDGRNNYCFVHNRPIVFIDPDGRFTVAGPILPMGGIFSPDNLPAVAAAVPPLMPQAVSNALAAISNPVIASSKEYIGDNYENCANCILQNWYGLKGKEYKLIYSQKYIAGTTKDSRIGNTFMNGINNTFEEAMATAEMISELGGGLEVNGVYKASYGPVIDVIGCFLEMNGITTPPSRMMADTWKEMMTKNPNSSILHTTHSGGALSTRNAIPLCDEDLRNRIDVMAISPGGLLQKGSFRNIQHYASTRDFIPVFDQIYNGTANCAPIIMLQPHPNTEWLDHGFNSPTFQPVIDRNITNFVHMGKAA